MKRLIFVFMFFMSGLVLAGGNKTDDEVAEGAAAEGLDIGFPIHADGAAAAEESVFLGGLYSFEEGQDQADEEGTEQLPSDWRQVVAAFREGFVERVIDAGEMSVDELPENWREEVVAWMAGARPYPLWHIDVRRYIAGNKR